MAKRQSTSRITGKESLSISLDLGDGLQRFVDIVQNKALRPAVYAAARTLYDEVKYRVPEHTGTLKASIYHWHDDKASVDGKQVYVVGVNKRKARHWWLIEFGHWQRYKTIKLPSGEFVTDKSQPLSAPKWVGPKPYLRPAYDAKIVTALEAAKSRMAEKIKELT